MRKILLSTCLALAIPVAAFAATKTEQAVIQATARLQNLYEQQLKSANPGYYDTSIGREREGVKATFVAELEELVTAAGTQAEGVTAEVSAFDRQQSLVRTLTQRQSEASVDLDLLKSEDRTMYGERPLFGTGSTRLTQSRAELLARVAVLEEELAAIQSVLPAQQERLSKLQTEQRIEQFSVVIAVLKYLLIVLAVVALERFLRLRVLPSLIRDQAKRYTAAKVLATLVYVTLAVTLIARLSADYPGTLTSFAIIGAALAVALQDVVKDILGWMLTIQSRRYQLGDRITVGKWTGDVIDISPLRTTVLEVSAESGRDLGRTGRVLAIPNSMILNQPVLNYNTTSDFLRMEQQVLISLQSDWKLARTLLLEILEEETGGFTETARMQEQLRMRQFYFAEVTHGPSVYIELSASGILLMLRFYAPVGQYRTITTRITEKILERFAKASPAVEITYPTSRAFATSLEPGEPLPQKTEKKG